MNLSMGFRLSGTSAAGGGGGGDTTFSDSFDYTAGTELIANGYTTATITAVGKLVIAAGGGAVQIDSNNSTHRVTRTSPPDPGSDNVYIEMDVVMNTVPTLNATRFTITNDSGDIEARVGRSAIALLKTGSTVSSGAWTPTAGVEYTIRLEVNTATDTINVIVAGITEATSSPAGLTAPHDRTFNFGITVGTDAAETSYLQINAVRIGAL